MPSCIRVLPYQLLGVRTHGLWQWSFAPVAHHFHSLLRNLLPSQHGLHQHVVDGLPDHPLARLYVVFVALVCGQTVHEDAVGS